MPESPLRTLSVDFAVQILDLVKMLKNRHETIVSNQIGRAGTSIGAIVSMKQYIPAIQVPLSAFECRTVPCFLQKSA